jgi:hypothetical protein
MIKKRIYKKIPFWIFSILFALYFFISLIFQGQTDHWLANQGIHILVLEGYGLFSLIMLLSIAGLRLSGHKLYSLITVPFWILLMIFFYAVYDYSKDYTLWLLLFFVFSNFIKFINFIRSEENFAGAWKCFYVTFIAFIASAFIVIFPTAFFFGAGNNLAYYSMWGVLYFVLLIVVDLISDYYEQKPSKRAYQVR